MKGLVSTIYVRPQFTHPYTKTPPGFGRGFLGGARGRSQALTEAQTSKATIGTVTFATCRAPIASTRSNALRKEKGATIHATLVAHKTSIDAWSG